VDRPPLDYLAAIRADALALGVAARQGPPDASVAACPGWDLGRLVGHVGTVHRWATAIVTTGHRPDRGALPPPPDDPAALPDWLDEGADRLLAALGDLDPEADVWNFSTAPNVGRFWPRRQAQETAMHRWDAQDAVGEPAPIDAELAADGIAELLEVWAPMQLHGRDGIDIGGSVRLVATDVDGDADSGGAGWSVRTDDGLFAGGASTAAGDVTVEAPASELLLLLWRRRTVGGAVAARLTGDVAVLERWLALGVP
jgi:uncharacterized protein (TIGR03083 family)